MGEFLKAYRAWWSEPFPHQSTKDELNELHAELATLDYWVADTVVPFAENDTLAPLKVDIRGAIRDIRQRLASVASQLRGQDQQLVAEYQRYVELLDAVFLCFIAVTSRAGTDDSGSGPS